MKKELLRITNLNYRKHDRKLLTGIQLCIFEGDSVCFLGLADSGKKILVDFICGEAEENPGHYPVYLSGQRVRSAEELKQAVYRMSDTSHIVQSWTVAEYIGLTRSRWLLLKKERDRQERETDRYFEELDVPILASSRMGDLSGYERMLVDIVKAASLGCRLIVMEGEFEDILPEEMERFHETLRLVLEKYGMGLIFDMSSSQSMMKYMKRYIFFRDGKITKKCTPADIQSERQLESYLLGTVQTRRKKRLDDIVSRSLYEVNEKHETVYSIRNLQLRNIQSGKIDFEKGKVCTFLSQNDRTREELFLVLSGRRGKRGTFWRMKEKEISTENLPELVRQRIVSAKKLNSREESFSNMTVNENLLLPSLQKLNSLEYMMAGNRLHNKLQLQVKHFNDCRGEQIKTLDTNDYITLSMEKWLMFNPRVLILLDPFELCDVYGVSIIKSYLMKMTRKGTAVIIIKARDEYVTDISDEIINLD